MSLLLPQLNLADNQLCGLDQNGRGTYTSEGIEAIAGALKVNPSLTEVPALRSNLLLPSLPDP